MSITLILIIMTGLISYQAFYNPEMRAKLLFLPTSIKYSKEWYRFISGGLIHADWGHLVINMMVLYQFGEFAESMFNTIFDPLTGRLVYLFFYLSAIVVASFPSYLRHQNNYAYAALGASGATSALVFAFILFNPWQWFLFPPLPAILFGVAYLFYSSYMDKRGGDRIGHYEHFWGAVYGLAFMLFIAFFVKPGLLSFFISQLMDGPRAFGS